MSAKEMPDWMVTALEASVRSRPEIVVALHECVGDGKHRIVRLGDEKVSVGWEDKCVRARWRGKILESVPMAAYLD